VLKPCGGDSALFCPPTTLQHSATIRRRSFLELLQAAARKLRGGFSVNEFSVEVTDAVTPVFVFAEFLPLWRSRKSLFPG